ncbi:acyl carrier protein [Streptomyces sp. M2CJ-2]|uniref:acyl carrier protein n=1 Tax=Streptomyces sp. M2CJ-2 TaxID=2803948 RepID=UPI0019268B29|nr:acyl carrier protein [Streptomyces sp. M2CJ-2]MBL3669475.1 acyl carrier protein [Streptomyces sp. M2CJ-2]
MLDKEELRATVAQVLDVEVSEVTDDANFVEDIEVDSLMALEVVVVLEKKYGVRLSETELRRITCLQNAYDLLLGKLQAA